MKHITIQTPKSFPSPLIQWTSGDRLPDDPFPFPDAFIFHYSFPLMLS